ncbi:SDR family oxidoreductase [Teredinibacter sp. KSP-S5-2]|uniref:SDR family oxidoreductase n=1 Tax=Teredinibacter sp. KSP-S5-2 TaxID=3034506 RepID=UPI002934D882|nr:SDR family oxidoreductase [Teredinibacter sp. KSP-S5-2]WNO09203.1 SDR family oxidoreductase [Teredinibacter sp. KSP-S5-2]
MFKKILVIGANGRIGKQLVKKLHDQGFAVRAMVRQQQQALFFNSMRIETVVADLEENFSSAFEGCDTVVFTAGSGAATGADKTLLIDLWAATKAVDYAQDYGIQNFLMISSRGAGNPDTGPAKIKYYCVAKHFADQHLINSSLQYLILRPGRLTDEPATGKITTSKPNMESEQHISREDVVDSVLYFFHHSNHFQKQIIELYAGENNLTDSLTEACR